MQINNTLFKRKILSFTLIQVALLSFLLILSVAVRLVLYPLSYLESLPLYFIVGFFFLWEMLQFFLVSREALEDSRNILRIIAMVSCGVSAYRCLPEDVSVFSCLRNPCLRLCFF